MKPCFQFVFDGGASEPDAVSITASHRYSPDQGYGFDFEPDDASCGPGLGMIDTGSAVVGRRPFYFSVQLAEGNYEVEVTLGDGGSATNTTLRVETRRLVLEDVSTAPGESKTIAFGVNLRSPLIAGTDGRVALTAREHDKLNWDGKLTLEFNGNRPAVSRLVIRKQADAVTLFLSGNSTAVDQDDEPYASWGQIITKYFLPSCIVANHAESGLTLANFIAQRRLEKVLSLIRPGDYFFIEFGHIDKKSLAENAAEEFDRTLAMAIEQIRRRDANPVLVTPACRRYFNPDGRLANTLGVYPTLIRRRAKLEGTPLIDINAMTRTLIESLGDEGSKKVFVWYPAGTWPDQESDFTDNTHMNAFGAHCLADLVMDAIGRSIPELLANVRPGFLRSPSLPPADYRALPLSPLSPVAIKAKTCMAAC